MTQEKVVESHIRRTQLQDIQARSCYCYCDGPQQDRSDTEIAEPWSAGEASVYMAGHSCHKGEKSQNQQIHSWRARARSRMRLLTDWAHTVHYTVSPASELA